MISRIGVRTSNTSAAAAFFELIAGSLLRGFKLLSVEIINATAAAQAFGLGKPAAIGVTPTSPVPLIPDDIALPYSTTASTAKHRSQVTSAIAWGTGPTVPDAFFARGSIPATIGATVKWTFDGGIFVPAGSTIILWGTGTNAANDVNVVVDESLAP